MCWQDLSNATWITSFVLSKSHLRFSVLRLDKCCLQAYFVSAYFDWTSAACKPTSIQPASIGQVLPACLFRIWTSSLPANMFRLGNIASFKHKILFGKYVCFDPHASIQQHCFLWTQASMGNTISLQSQASIWPCSFLRSDSLWSTSWTCDYFQGGLLRFKSWTTKPFEATYSGHISGLPYTAKLKPVALLCSSPAPTCQ